MRDELLAREIFNFVKEGQVLFEVWCKHCNTIWPHSSLVYRLQATATFIAQPSQIQQV